MDTKNKVGRPRKAENEKASALVGFKATETDKLFWEQCAKYDGLRLSQWMSKLAKQASKNKKYRDLTV